MEDLWSLTSFFGYSTQTFVLAVNLLDRFLAMMRVRRDRARDVFLLLSCDAKPPARRSSPSTCRASASAASTWRPK